MATEVHLELFGVEELRATEQSIEDKAIEYTALHVLQYAGCREIVKGLLSQGKVEQAYSEYKKGSSNYGFANGEITYMGHRQEIKIKNYEWFSVTDRELFEIVREHCKSQQGGIT